MKQERPLHSVPDDELLRRLADLLGQSRRTEADLVAHIGEADERKLYTREASPSMFAYCTERLHLSEAEAYLRITVARASREYPVLLTLLADGRLHLTGIAKLVPHLTPENADGLLRRAAHRSRRQIEELVAEIAPRPNVPALIRRLPISGLPSAAPSAGVDRAPTPERLDGSLERPGPGLQLRPDGVAPPWLPNPTVLVTPLAPGRYKVQFTASATLHDKLSRLQALMRFHVPDADLAAIIEEAVTEKLERLEARRFARTRGPGRRQLHEGQTAATSRHVPAAVRRAVHERDGAQCRYTDERGRRCSERKGLEFHHRYPFGQGGDHSPSNISLLCRAHNAFLAEYDYGREAIGRRRDSGIWRRRDSG